MAKEGHIQELDVARIASVLAGGAATACRVGEETACRGHYLEVVLLVELGLAVLAQYFNCAVVQTSNVACVSLPHDR